MQAIQRKGGPPTLIIQIGRMLVPREPTRSQEKSSDILINRAHLLNLHDCQDAFEDATDSSLADQSYVPSPTDLTRSLTNTKLGFSLTKDNDQDRTSGAPPLPLRSAVTHGDQDTSHPKSPLLTDRLSTTSLDNVNLEEVDPHTVAVSRGMRSQLGFRPSLLIQEANLGCML